MQNMTLRPNIENDYVRLL